MQTDNDFTLSIAKDHLSALAATHFNGDIRLIDKPEDVREAINAIRSAGTVGFDTETRPSFQKGQLHSVALLQLSTEDCCWLFRLNMIGMPDEIKDLLEDRNVRKIGLSIHDDFHNLRRIRPVEPQGFIELQDYTRRYHIADKSLTKIYAILFGSRISKGQRLTNWEASELSVYQQSYAALDAYACLKIYNYLESGQFDPARSPFRIQVTQSPTPTDPSCETS